MKKIKLFITTIILISLASCEKENNQEELPQTINEYKNWYEQHNDLKIKQNSLLMGNLNWNNASSYNNKLYVPLTNPDIDIRRENSESFEKIFSHPFLVFHKQNDEIILNLKVFISTDSNEVNLLNIFKLPNISFNQNNEIENDNFISKKSDESPSILCETFGLYEHSYDPNTGLTEVTLIDVFTVCNSDWEWNEGRGDFGGGSGTGGSPKNNNSFNTRSILTTLAPDIPIENLQEHLKCFDTSKKATITLYANQPTKNSSASFNIFNTKNPVGHAFISISQGLNTATFGFYPKKEGIKDKVIGPSIIGDNGGDEYDVSISMSVSGSDLEKIIKKATDFPPFYELYDYNCTDYALGLANLAGVNIPNAWGVFPGGGGGDNPGKLGQIIRSKKNQPGFTVNPDGGKAPKKNNTCK